MVGIKGQMTKIVYHVQIPAAILFTRYVVKIILYVYYKTNVCQTHNIKRLTVMIVFKVIFWACNR